MHLALILFALWIEPPPDPQVAQRPTLAPLISKARPSILVIETPGPQLPEGHPVIAPDDLKGEGSGVIIHPSGLALTNQHVIECANDLRARVGDDPTWYPIKVVARDAAADLALLQLEGRDTWPALPLRNSDTLQLGDFVVALGHPFGLTHSVSLGILSGRGRPPSASDRQAVPYDYLQTDAAINPGNSGGPLIDLTGAVVGINTAIHARGQGIGFAIPAAAIRRMLPALRAKGRFVPGWMSVRIKPGEGGVVVAGVQAGGAADGRLQEGDLITGVDDTPTPTVHALQVATRMAGGGAQVRVQLTRAGVATTVEMTLGDAPAPPDPCAERPTPSVPDQRLPVFRLFDGLLGLP